MLTGSQIREKFLQYFEQRGHKHVHSSSLVPANDPTLLFTNAGMNQFKDVFLGLEKRAYNRATTSQKCVRAGGKHNDLENVGFTNRHHTFFEMLGNFSFGDYFKKEAIAYAWELVTSPEWFGIDKTKLYITFFEGIGADQIIPRDREAEEEWAKQGVPTSRIIPMGLKDNFWAMGDTGPCGPCSEIHYDMGIAAIDNARQPECSAGNCTFPCDCGRYVEIWNLVFMQYNRYCIWERDGFPRDWSEKQKSDHKHSNDCLKMDLLPKPSIDTGAGLERVACVLQNVISNYETDLFTPLIARAAELTGVSAKKESEKEANSKSAASLRVIADHARASTFLISDGVLPGNEGRSYVLRKIMRRAIQHGRMLGQEEPFLHQMVYAVKDLMKDAYPELEETAERVAGVVKGEEIQFGRTMELGVEKFEAKLVDNLSPVLADLAKQLNDSNFFEQLSTFQQASLELGRQIEASLAPARKAAVEISKKWDQYAAGIQEAAEKIVQSQDFKNFQKFAEDFVVVRNSFVHAAPAFKALRAAPSPEKIKKLLDTADHIQNSTASFSYSGEDAFKLYDTFGLPKDFIQDSLRDQGLPLDESGFDRAMAEQRDRARASWKGGSKAAASPAFRELSKTNFEGYRQTESSDCEVIAIVANGAGVQELKAGQEGEVVLDHTPFYADSGGQVGDTGWFYSNDRNTVVAEVRGCVMPVQGVRAHRVLAKQDIHIKDRVTAVVNADVRLSTVRNHTGTHLLHAALREVLGKHVKQQGSLVEPARLRFDFSHFTGVADEELQDIEDIVNKEVLRNTKVQVIEDVPIDVAVNEYKAMALFGEKYGDKVRVIKIGDFSTELCGGIHTGATGEIGLVKLLHESSVSSGVRRVEAVTGEGSLKHFRADHQIVDVASHFLGQPQADAAPAESFKRALQNKDEELKKLRKELEQARMKSASASVSAATDQVKEVQGIKVLAQRADNVDRNQMRTLVDNLRNKLGSGVVVLGTVIDVEGEKSVALIVGVTKDLTGKIQAGKIVGLIAQKVGGKGGGRPDLAEAGGKDVSGLDQALASATEVVASLLS